jgi:hypothetical protein
MSAMEVAGLGDGRRRHRHGGVEKPLECVRALVGSAVVEGSCAISGGVQDLCELRPKQVGHHLCNDAIVGVRYRDRARVVDKQGVVLGQQEECAVIESSWGCLACSQPLKDPEQHWRDVLIPGRCGLDYIYDLNASFNGAAEKGDERYILFLDTKKAFDSVDHR